MPRIALRWLVAVVAVLSFSLVAGSVIATAAPRAHHAAKKKKKKKKVLRGRRGPQGPPGPPGPTGPQGPAGPSFTIRWHNSVATPGASSTSANTIVLARFGPFTVLGECYTDHPGFDPSGTYTAAVTKMTSSQDGSSLDGLSSQPHNFGPQSGEKPLQFPAEGNNSGFQSAYSGGWTFQVQSQDNGTAGDGTVTAGVRDFGASGPACQFSGRYTSEV